MGGTWRIPVLHGLASANFVDDLKNDGTYSELTFNREYESIWGGGNANSFFGAQDFDKSRTLEEALWGAPPDKKDKVIFAYDVGRLSDQSSLTILNLKSFGSSAGSFTKQVVNLFNFQEMHFTEQAIEIKRLAMLYGAEKIIIDANGIGIGLVDDLVIENTDPQGNKVPAFGIDPVSDPKGDYKKYYRTERGFDELVYMIKPTAGFNGEVASLLSSQIQSGKIQFLIDDQMKFDKLKRTDRWKNMAEFQRVKELQPFKLTKILREEMLNMKKKSGASTSLDRIATGMKKDMYSALSYAVWYARQLELKNKNTTKGLDTLQVSTSSQSAAGSGRGGLNGKFKRTGTGRFSRRG